MRIGFFQTSKILNPQRHPCSEHHMKVFFRRCLQKSPSVPVQPVQMDEHGALIFVSSQTRLIKPLIQRKLHALGCIVSQPACSIHLKPVARDSSILPPRMGLLVAAFLHNICCTKDKAIPLCSLTASNTFACVHFGPWRSAFCPVWRPFQVSPFPRVFLHPERLHVTQ